MALATSSIEFFELLPDCLIDHIISFLPSKGKERLNLSILSRRLRQLYKSSIYTSFIFRGDDIKTHEQLTSYLNEFLTGLVEDDRKIYRFELRCVCPDNENNNNNGNDDDTLNVAAATRVQCRVDEDLYLDINLLVPKSKPHLLPRITTTSPDSTTLNLFFHTQYLELAWGAHWNLSSSIQVLSLSCVRVLDEDSEYLFSIWITENFRCLKKLSLTNVDVTHSTMKWLNIANSSIEDLSINQCFPKLEYISISCPKLHTLSITHLYENEEEERGDSSTIGIEIYAAKMENITWNGNRVGKYYGLMKNYNAPHYASIDIKDSPCDNVVWFLSGLVMGARVLQLGIDVIQDLFKNDRLPILFDNARDLVVKVDLLDETQMLAILSFLKGLPNLCNLTISSKSSEQSNTHNLLLNGPVGLEFLKDFVFPKPSSAMPPPQPEYPLHHPPRPPPPLPPHLPS